MYIIFPGTINRTKHQEKILDKCIVDVLYYFYKEYCMNGARKKYIIQIGTQEDFDKLDIEYWAKAKIKEKLETVTYLRECFYGKEATTGRLQRIYKVFKR